MSEKRTLEERLQRVEDLEEIRALKARYCHYADRGFDGAGHDDVALAELFTEDGVWESSFGPNKGREAIAAASSKFYSFGFHLAINPHIVVEGDTAHGRWWGVIPVTVAEGQGVWMAGCYEDQFVRTPKGWRFKHLLFRAAFRSTYEAGWGKERFAKGLMPNMKAP